MCCLLCDIVSLVSVTYVLILPCFWTTQARCTRVTFKLRVYSGHQRVPCRQFNNSELQNALSHSRIHTRTHLNLLRCDAKWTTYIILHREHATREPGLENGLQVRSVASHRARKHARTLANIRCDVRPRASSCDAMMRAMIRGHTHARTRARTIHRGSSLVRCLAHIKVVASQHISAHASWYARNVLP